MKRNQPKLHEAIQNIKLEHPPVDSYYHSERNRGKDITWAVHVYSAHIGVLHKEWVNLNRIIQVHKIVEHKDRVSHSERFYISDLTTYNAAFYHHGIRGHWAIENKLHRTKDIFHSEDNNGIKKGSGPLTMSTISSIALNIHQKKGGKSITDNQIKFCCHLKEAMAKYGFK